MSELEKIKVELENKNVAARNKITKVGVNITLDSKLIELIDSKRHVASRSAYINYLLLTALKERE